MNGNFISEIETTRLSNTALTFLSDEIGHALARDRVMPVFLGAVSDALTNESIRRMREHVKRALQAPEPFHVPMLPEDELVRAILLMDVRQDGLLADGDPVAATFASDIGPALRMQLPCFDESVQ